MKNVPIRSITKEYYADHVKRRQIMLVFLVLSLIVSLMVVWELRGTGISMANETECGMSEHQHSEECYEYYLVCGKTEGDAEDNGQHHVHTEQCYEQRLICEIPEHIHSVECLGIEPTEPVQDVQMKEADAMADITENTNDSTAEDEVTAFDSDITLNLDMSHPNILADDIIYDDFYVITANGERHKHRIHEYLDILGSISNGQVSEGSGFNVERTKVDTVGSAIYIQNADTNLGRYFVFQGDVLDLVIYTETDDEIADSDITVSNSNILSFTVENQGNKHIIHLTASNSRSGNVSVKYGSNYFYMNVKASNSSDSGSHADIEITDGGYYELDEYISSSGQRYTMMTHYDSVISDVNRSDLYKSDSSTAAYYEWQDYENIGSEGGTQYEFTSAYITLGMNKRRDGTNGGDNGHNHFKPQDVNKAVFDVQLLLSPKSCVLTPVDANGIPTGEPITLTDADAIEAYGKEEIHIDHAIFELNRQSVLDALNKCPNHSGLDFTIRSNVGGALKYVPASLQLESIKTYEAGSLSEQPFVFELYSGVYDEDSEPISEVSTADEQVIFGEPDDRPLNLSLDANDDPDEKQIVYFKNQYYLAPGTYHYTIKEKIPETAVSLGNGYYKDGDIYYSDKLVSVDVVVAESDDGSALVIDSITYDSAEDTDVLEFVNKKVTETDIEVEKSWSSPDDPNNPTEVYIKLYKSENEGTESLCTYNGASIFELSADNEWKMTFENLPVQFGNVVYSYRVEETTIEGYSPVYTVTDGDGVQKVEILNVSKDDVQINVRKDWKDSEGNALTDIPVDSVTAKLKRRYKDVSVPITVKVVSSDDNTKNLAEPYTASAYVGGSYKFSLKDISGKLTDAAVLNCEGCSCTGGDDGVFTMTNIQNNAVLTLQSKGLKNVDPLLYYSGADMIDNDDVNPTVSGGGFPGFPGQTQPKVSGVSDEYWSYIDGADYQALYRQGRSQTYDGIDINLDTSVFEPGKTYSFCCYIKQDGSSNVDAQLSIVYTTRNNFGQTTDTQTNIVTSVISQGEWAKIENTAYTIPAAATDNVRLRISIPNTYGWNNMKQNNTSSFYIDDVVIVPVDDDIISEGVPIEVEQDGTVKAGAPYKFDFDELEMSIPDSSKNWYNDTDWGIDMTLSSANDWAEHYEKDDLSELSSRIYQYYVEETVSLDNYEVSYSGQNIATNTENNPIVIENKNTGSYRLPDTGGYGAEKIRFAGLMLFCTGTFIMLINYRQRRKAA